MDEVVTQTELVPEVVPEDEDDVKPVKCPRARDGGVPSRVVQDEEENEDDIKPVEVQLPKANDSASGKVQPLKLNLTSGDSSDTLYDTAEGAEEDDLVEETPGPKEDQLFGKLRYFVAKNLGKKGSESRKVVSLAEVLRHNTVEDFWVVIDGMVFDLSMFLRGEIKHPGGKTILFRQFELAPETRHDADLRFIRWHNPGGNAVRRAYENFVGDLDEPLPMHMRDPDRRTVRQKLGCWCLRRRSCATV
eukprot:TRINITY_DN5355_c0_g1_i2.p1 TRINITY_DN5355_c0_g1~~TRINITY_DN5355_c0_g1_i2.p1  ORF type:complete len:289 (-),score=46.42 TRINITY_DN5355_c0_g1_i2:162-902(-)